MDRERFQQICAKWNTIGSQTTSNAPSPSKPKILPPIHRLPNELLMKIILDTFPRTEWPTLELIDPKFRDAVLLAWRSLREVDLERDFIYSQSISIVMDDRDEMINERGLHRQIVRKTESIFKKLLERSPLITWLSGVSLLTEYPSLNKRTVRYLSKLQHLETIRFTRSSFTVRIVNGCEFSYAGDIHLSDLAEFVDSTQSRAMLKEIRIERLSIPDDDVFAIDRFDRLRTRAFANDSNDPTQQLLRLESFSIGSVFSYHHAPLAFFAMIDASRMATLSFGTSYVEPDALTSLIERTPRLRHIDFALVRSCTRWCTMDRCLSEHLLIALESHSTLTSLGINTIRYGAVRMRYDCECRRFVPMFERMLTTIGPRLERFVFYPGYKSQIDMREICHIIRIRMPRLKSLKLCANRLDSDDLRGIADSKDLKEIELDVSFTDDHIANDVLSMMINKSPRLKRFVAHYVYADQRVAMELCKLDDLVDLRIPRSRFSVETFHALSRRVLFAKNLQVLCLGPIDKGVESGLIALVSNATQLRVLVAHENVTDRLLQCLAASCPNLEKFCATSADGITFNGAQMLVDRCPKLRWLEVENSTGTLKSSLKHLKFDRYRKRTHDDVLLE